MQPPAVSLHSWFIHNDLVFNPTKTEAICFGTSPRLQSLSNITSIEFAGVSVPLVDYVKLLGVMFDKHINFDQHIFNVLFILLPSVLALSHIRTFLDSKLRIPLPVILRFQIRLSISFLLAFLLAISIVFSASETPWLESLLVQLPTPPQL